jgi:hypothetical protein
MQFSPSHHLIPLRSKYFPQHSVQWLGYGTDDRGNWGLIPGGGRGLSPLLPAGSSTPTDSRAWIGWAVKLTTHLHPVRGYDRAPPRPMPLHSEVTLLRYENLMKYSLFITIRSAISVNYLKPNDYYMYQHTKPLHSADRVFCVYGCHNKQRLFP